MSLTVINSLLECFAIFYNPYRVCRKFLQKQGATDVYQYGETPLDTMALICKMANITKYDHFFELGAGRGKTAFFVQKTIGCKVTAIEQIPYFVKVAKFLNTIFSIGLDFRCENFLLSDLSQATVIYLYGTCLSDETIIQLCSHFHPRQKIISISYPLSDYNPKFTTIDTFPVTFPWGETEAYINVL